MNDFKLYTIGIYGCGTPLYIVAAESKEAAYEMVREKLSEKYRCYRDILPEIDSMKEVPGFSVFPKPSIIDLYNIQE